MQVQARRQQQSACSGVKTENQGENSPQPKPVFLVNRHSTTNSASGQFEKRGRSRRATDPKASSLATEKGQTIN